MARPAASDSLRLVAAASAPVVLAVAATVLLVAQERHVARLTVDRDVRADNAAAVGALDDALRSQLTTAETVGGSGARTIPAVGATSTTVSPSNLILARDGGAPVLDDEATPASIIVPLYTGTPPTTTIARRLAVTGYRLVPLSLTSVLSGLAPEVGGIAVEGPHRVVQAAPARPRPGSRTSSAPLDPSVAPDWSVTSWRPAPGTPGSAWFWVAGLLLTSTAASVALFVGGRGRAREHLRQGALERDLRLVSGLAPIVQASLDLADVVPAAVSHLGDGLELEGLTLSIITELEERPLFSWGDAPDANAMPLATVPEVLAPGETFALALIRGGRSIGVMRIVAGAQLHRSDLRALTTASELLGSTLANAESFNQQRALLQRMRSVDELKTVFLATASHELRTPVVSIVGFSSLLLEEWNTLEAEQRHLFLERIVFNARALDTLIEDLLDFSRLERGMRPAGDQVFDLGEAVRRMLAEHPDLCVDHELVSVLPHGHFVRGSTSAVERILSNLVGNAAKYSPAGTTITVTVRTDGGRVLLDVDDQGTGVPEADRERIFSRFYRGSGDAVIKTRGAGIGLAIVAEFTAAMQGTAAVMAAPGGGARFRISLPKPLAVETSSEGEHHVPVA